MDVRPNEPNQYQLVGAIAVAAAVGLLALAMWIF